MVAGSRPISSLVMQIDNYANHRNQLDKSLCEYRKACKDKRNRKRIINEHSALAMPAPVSAAQPPIGIPAPQIHWSPHIHHAPPAVVPPCTLTQLGSMMTQLSQQITSNSTDSDSNFFFLTPESKSFAWTWFKKTKKGEMRGKPPQGRMTQEHTSRRRGSCIGLSLKGGRWI